MQQPPTDGLIFAAGFGTRMGALTKNLPKPLLELREKPLIDRAIETLSTAGVQNIFVNAHYLHEKVTDHLLHADATVLIEQPEILDTGGGLKNARRSMSSDTVVTINPDGHWVGANPVTALVETWDPAAMGALLLLVPLAAAESREPPGDFWLAPDGQITLGGPFVYTGVQIINASATDHIDEQVFSMHRLWDRFSQEERLFGAVYDGVWCDVGTPEGLRRAEDMIDRNSV